MIGTDIKRFSCRCRKHAAAVRISCGQQKSGNAPGQRGLAYTARPGQQPGVMQLAGVPRVQKAGLGHILADQGRGVARMRRTAQLVWMGGIVGHGFRLTRMAAVGRGQARPGTT